MKERLDVMLVQRGLVESREKAQGLILAGKVTVNGEPVCKTGRKYDDDVQIDLKEGPKFVSRGGGKLDCAFEKFGLNVTGLICMDVGSSTGGFTDCLLQHGAAKVIAVDVGRGLLHWKLRNDPRVTVLEGINARYLSKKDIDIEPQFAVIDVSFISLTKVMPAVIEVLAQCADVITLIKPQFEAGRKQVEKGGVVRNPAVHEEVKEVVKKFGTRELGLIWLGVCESPVRGPAGNIEFLAHWRKTQDGKR